MNQNHTEKTGKKWLGYILYCILLTYILLYCRFPSEAFGDYLQNTVNKYYPDFSFSIQRASLFPPLGLKLIQAELSEKETPRDIFFRAESLLIRPKILSLFKEAPEIMFECNASRGNVSGNIQLTEKTLKGYFESAFTLDSIQIPEKSVLSDAFGRQIEGTISGSGTFNGKSDSLITGSGEAEILFSEIRITLLQPVMTLEHIEFSEILLHANLKNRKLELPDIELKGEKINGSVSGVLYLKNDLLMSSLDLEGRVEPAAELVREISGGNKAASILNQMLKGGKLYFKISGTLKDPRVRFL